MMMGFALGFVFVLGFVCLFTSEQDVDTLTNACPYKQEPYDIEQEVTVLEPDYQRIFQNLHRQVAYDPNNSKFKLPNDKEL